MHVFMCVYLQIYVCKACQNMRVYMYMCGRIFSRVMAFAHVIRTRHLHTTSAHVMRTGDSIRVCKVCCVCVMRVAHVQRTSAHVVRV